MSFSGSALKHALAILIASALTHGYAQTGKSAQSKPPQPAKTAQPQKPTQKPAQKPTQKPAQKPAHKSVQKPAQKSVQKPVQTALPAFSESSAVAGFIAHMVANHKFDAKTLAEQFAAINPNQRVLTLFRPKPPPDPSKPAVRSWKSYSSRFLNESRVESGLLFWQENAATLKRAFDQYGVPPEIIVAIIGVETLYGRNTGSFGVMEALASLAFHDPGRGDFFREELEHFLLLARENGFDPLKIQGSYAGAIGIPQFMPGSWRKYAVDFDGDKIIDLERSVADSIGSIANYLNKHGWQAGQAIAHKVTIRGNPKDAWLKAGMLPSLNVKELAEQGVQGAQDSPDIATFIELPTPKQPAEYWLGYQNYYAITRYNRSTFYSMSVFMLAERLKARSAAFVESAPTARLRSFNPD